jgi:hypothetical protein
MEGRPVAGGPTDVVGLGGSPSALRCAGANVPPEILPPTVARGAPNEIHLGILMRLVGRLMPPSRGIAVACTKSDITGGFPDQDPTSSEGKRAFAAGHT